MNTKIIEAIGGALERYREATKGAADVQAQEDFSRLVAITEKLLTSLRAGDLASSKTIAMGFSRQVSDSYSTQPPEFKPLAELIAIVKKAVV